MFYIAEILLAFDHEITSSLRPIQHYQEIFLHKTQSSWHQSLCLTADQHGEYSNDGRVDCDEPPLSTSPTFYLEHCCQDYFRSFDLFSWGPFKVTEDGNSAASLCNLLQLCTTLFKHIFLLISKFDLSGFNLWPQPHLNLSVQPRSLAPSVLYLFFKKL